MKIEEIIDKDRWAVVEKSSDSEKMFIRFRNELKPEYDYSDYPVAIHIFWDFEANDLGMPIDTSILKQMEKFENDLVTAVESNYSGILVGVLTMNGYRQWLYCLKSESEFIGTLNTVTFHGEPYPIELERESNSGWDYFFSVMYQQGT